jgi:hypothetical protein
MKLLQEGLTDGDRYVNGCIASLDEQGDGIALLLLADEALEVFHAFEAFSPDADDYVARTQCGA